MNTVNDAVRPLVRQGGHAVFREDFAVLVRSYAEQFCAAQVYADDVHRASSGSEF